MAVPSSHRRISRALLAIAALGAALVGVVPRPAGATADVTASRIAGPNRYATAASIAAAAYSGGAETVVLASGETFPDALAGAALAGAVGGPIVLTAKAHLSPEARRAIEQLQADNVIILGGTAAVSSAVEDELDGVEVSRVAGSDRFVTAAAVASRIGSAAIAALDGKKTALVASGSTFADALAGGGIAANGAGTGVHPVLLAGQSVPPATGSAIDELGIEQVVILGGTAAVSNAAEADLVARTGNPAIRIAGSNRYATAAAVAQAMVDRFASPATTTLLANGQVFADALAGGVLSGVRQAPVLLTPQVALADESRAFLVKHAKTVATVIALGGTASVSTTALQQAEKAAETASDGEAAANDDYTVSPTAPASQANNSTRTYTASRLTGVAEVDIVLLPCANVTTSSGGRTFRNTNSNTVADGGAEAAAPPDRASTPAAITRVNGAAVTLVNDDYADDVEPKADDTLQFTVAGPSSATAAGGCVQPVVIDDADGDSTFDVTAANPAVAEESFGVGGSTTFSPSSATTPGSGTELRSANVYSNAESDNSFVACRITDDDDSIELVDADDCDVYDYDSNDTFTRGSESLELLEFETYLSSGDDVSGRYVSTAGGSSTFVLNDESPLPPTLTDVERTDDGVTISFTEPVDPNRTEYEVLRHDVGTNGSCKSSAEEYEPITEELDELIPAALPGAPRTYEDASADADTTYCYVVVTRFEGDQSVASNARRSDAPGADEGRPVIDVAKGNDAPDDGLGDGDVHQLVFSEEMGDGTDEASYTVQGANGVSATITCDGQAVECQLAGSALLVFIETDFGDDPPTYPLQITNASGMEDTSGNAVDLSDGDTTIEGNSLE